MASEICKNKFCNEVKNMSWLQKVPYDVKNTLRRQNKTSKCSQKKVEKFVMMSNTSWRQKVCHDDKKFVMMSKTFHDVKRFVITLKSSSWCQKVCHDVKRLSWSKKYTMMPMTSKTHFHIILFMKWCKKCHEDKKLVMTSKIRHHAKNTSLRQKSSPWRQNVHDVKKTPWWQHVRHYFKRFVMTSRRRHYVKKCVMTSKVLL